MKVSAAGGKPVKLFENRDAVNSNCLHPRWSADGRRVEFVAMKGGAWARWSMNADGSDAHPVDGAPDLASSISRASDLVVGAISRVRRRVLEPAIGEASWNAERTAVIFERCTPPFGCEIVIASPGGRDERVLTKGTDPDWQPLPK
jgi:hypothetical protein